MSRRSWRWTWRRVGTAAPSTLELRQEPAGAKEVGADETHHRMRKTEDRGEEIRSPETEVERPEESEDNRKIRVEAKARCRAGDLAVGTFNVLTFACNGKNSIGHSEVILNVCQELGCDIIGLQEARPDGQSTFIAAGRTGFCSGADSSKYERKKTHGVRLAVREPIVAWMEKGSLVVECINGSLMKVCIQHQGKSNRVSCLVVYVQTLCSFARQEHRGWNALDIVVAEVPIGAHLFVLIDANARMGKRQSRCADSTVICVYGRHELNDNGERLLLHTVENNLALLKTFCATPNRGVSHTF